MSGTLKNGYLGNFIFNLNTFRMLNCGHSFCEQCLKLMYRPSTKQLQCPSCLMFHNFALVEDLSKLIKNFTLLSLVENAKFSNTPKEGNPKGKKLGKSKTVLIGDGQSASGLTKKSASAKKSGAFQMDLEDLEENKSEEEYIDDEDDDEEEGGGSSKSKGRTRKKKLGKES